MRVWSVRRLEWRHLLIESRLVSFQFTHVKTNHCCGSRRMTLRDETKNHQCHSIYIYSVASDRIKRHICNLMKKINFYLIR